MSDDDGGSKSLDEEARRLLDLKPGERPQRARLRPRDAATLIIVKRGGADGPLVLMGQRHRGHVFMANKYVFPGGRIDIGDYRAPAARELKPETAAKLAIDIRTGAAAAKPRGLAMAAVRETFEETGLIIGARGPARADTRAAGWRPFHEAGARPVLDGFDFIARAITPPGRPRRFDTRFLSVDVARVLNEPDDLSGASGELVDLNWFTLERALSLDLPRITAIVLQELAAREADPAAASSRPIPFYYMSGASFRCDLI